MKSKQFKSKEQPELLLIHLHGWQKVHLLGLAYILQAKLLWMG
jgi:hypothetical protein